MKRNIKGKYLGIVSLTVVAALCGTSCKMGNKYPKETAALDSLNIQVRKADSVITNIDTAKIKDCNAHITGSIELLKMAHKDTMSSGAAEIFRNYNNIRWNLETFMGKRAVMRNEMKKSMDQMTHLSHDIKNGLIKADSVQIYYGFEVKRATELIEASKLTLGMMNSQLPLYPLIAPKADSLISLVKNHKNI